MIQLDLDGFEVPYTCKKCSRCFGTMKDSSKHHATKHKIRLQTRITVNLALENFKLISTRIEVLQN